MEIRRCMKCMEELSENAQFCPACGAKVRDMEQPGYALNCNDMLHGRYLIGGVLGQGGFGITYIGMDMTLNVKVAIKEYFPMGLATREAGKSQRLLWNSTQMGGKERQGGYESFLKEARKMAKIDRIPSIVRVRDMFLDNETAYIVMDYVEGITLKQKLSQEGPISFSECIALLRPMMEDLEKVHKQGMIHRDISPDNIMIQSDGSVRLLDLGAAKDMTAAQGVSSQVVAKKGFSPLEQYQSGGEVGTWTDVYALCATIYYCITGKLMPDALDRIDKEEINFPDSLKEPLSEKNKEALRAGLEVRVNKRTQSVEELLRQLDAGKIEEKAAGNTQQEGEERAAVSAGQQAAQGQNPKSASNFQQQKGIGAVPTAESGPSKAAKTKKSVVAAIAAFVAIAACLTVAVFIITLSSFKSGKDSEKAGTFNDGHMETAESLEDEESKEQPENLNNSDASENDSFDASGYIKAVLDNSYKNDSTAFVEQKIGTEEEAKELYDSGIKSEVESLVSGVDISEELQSEFTTVLQDIFKNVKYTVGEAEKQDDGSYVVEIKYQKMKLFAAAMEKFQEGQQAYSDEISEKVQNGGEAPTEAEISEEIYTILKDALKEASQNAEYEDEASTTVRVELNDKQYIANEEDIVALEYALFDIEEAGEESVNEGEESKELPVMMEDTDINVVLGSELKREQICSITFQDNLKNQTEDAWDVSEKQDGTVMAWVSPTENDMYELYIGGEGGVQAPKSCNNLFGNYTDVEEINFNGCFDTSQVTDMREMFSCCFELSGLDVSNFDTGQVTDMSFMFSHSDWIELDLSSFDTSRVTDMACMFSGCEKLIELNVSRFDTSRVTDMLSMFSGCENLKKLDLSSFDTGHVTNMSSMFENCSNLKKLDLSGFDMSKVTSDEDMFKDCPAKVTGL